MKKINILSLVQAFASLPEESYVRFLQHYGIGVKNDEVGDLTSFVGALCKIGCDISIFDHFYVGYKIPQIGKEFDLLRFGVGCVVNIELKRVSTREKIEKQLKRNRYYLGFVSEKIYNFCFVSEACELFVLNANGQLEVADLSQVVAALKDMTVRVFDNVDDLFNPSDYLVSPFNSTQKFINNEYFLTQQQEKIVNEVFKSISDSSSATFVSIRGGAGTGKTLLTYDIAKRLISAGKKPLVIHCGYLNGGQRILNNVPGWNILSIRDWQAIESYGHDFVIVDEVQRIYPHQLNKIVDFVRAVNGVCILSHDKLQTLSSDERVRDIDNQVNSIPGICVHALTDKIRTNKEVASFIKMLFNNKVVDNAIGGKNIELNFFCSENDARYYLEVLAGHGWKVLRFTPSRFNSEHHEKYSYAFSENSHKVIGQEFDCVAVAIDSYFSYNNNGDLIYSAKSHYDVVRMLFQNITRTRKKLNVVVINNPLIFDKCVSILNA